MTTRLGTIYTTDSYTEIEVLDSRGLATYVVIDERNDTPLHFDIEKANTIKSYTREWVENNEQLFHDTWKFQQTDGEYTWE